MGWAYLLHDSDLNSILFHYLIRPSVWNTTDFEIRGAAAIGIELSVKFLVEAVSYLFVFHHSNNTAHQRLDDGLRNDLGYFL